MEQSLVLNRSKEFFLRSLTVIIGAPLVVLTTLHGSWPFYALLSISLIISVFEWVKMAHQSLFISVIWGFLALFTLGAFPFNPSFLVFIACIFLVAFAGNFIEQSKLSLHQIISCFGIVYILCSFKVILNFSQNDQKLLLLWLFILIWTADTAAFLVGRLIGGPKLAPKISPGKTWSGFLGGTFIALIVGLWSASLLGISHTFLSCFLLVIAAAAGDLLESAVKRYYKVKDSGALIPGHGGFLDRLDSLFLVSLVAAFFY